MKTHHLLLIAFSVQAALSANSQAGTCPLEAVRKYPSWRTECRCGDELESIQLTLPTAFQLIAVCALRSGLDQKTIPQHQYIGLDKYDQNGNWVNASFFLRGHVRLRGSLEMPEGSLDGGELFFHPDRWPQMPDTPIKSYLREFVLVPVGTLATYKIDSTVKRCSRAKATIAFSVVEVKVMHGAEDEGSYPLDAKPIEMGPYQPCAAR
jgi:hypothetical protein